MLKRYVSISGKDTNDGSKTKPFRNVQYGIDQLRKAIATGTAKEAALLIEEGNYQEDLVLYSNISLYRYDEKAPFSVDSKNGTTTSQVKGAVIIERKTDGSTLITIEDATNITVRGLKLEGHTKSTSTWKKGGRGIVIRNAKRIYIESCQIWNCWTTVGYKGKEAGTPQDPFTGDSQVTDSSSGAGIFVENSSTISISDNFFNNNRCDEKYAIPSPFDFANISLNLSMTLSAQGVDLKFTGKCLRRYLKEHPEVYRNGGGAVYCVNSSSVLVDGNLVTNNAAARGGGIRFGNKAYGFILDNHIANNEAWVDGGGIAVWDYDRAVVTRREVLIASNYVVENSSRDDGGGIYLTAKTVARLEGNELRGNASGANGGGLRVTFGSLVSVKETVFKNNRANTDAASDRPDNKDGGGAVAIQNSSVTFTNCTFERNEVLGFAGGGVYCNTVSYDGVGEKLGEKFFGEGFQDILVKKYRFTESKLVFINCAFENNKCHGQTCYGREPSDFDKMWVAASADDGCDAFLTAYAAYTNKKKCDVTAGSGMKSGTAGGAMYVLQKEGGIPIFVTIQETSFKNDESNHYDKEQRAAVVMHNCKEVALVKEQLSIIAPTLYKLSLHNVRIVNSNNSTYLTCSNGSTKSADAQIYLRGVTCN